MKILLWATHYLPAIGGLEVQCHCLALQLKKMGHEVRVIANHMNSKKFDHFFIDGIEVNLFPFTAALLHHHLQGLAKIQTDILQIVDEFGPDVINVHGWFECFCFFQTRIVEKRGAALCITVHGLLEQKDYKTKECLKLWKMAGAVNVVSKVLLTSLQNFGLSHPYLQVIYNGLSMPEIALVADPEQVLVMVGRLSDEKGYDTAMFAIEKLVKKYPKLKAILVGNGPEYPTLVSLRGSLGLDEVIEMTGFVDPKEVIHYIDRASIVLIPSSYESFCLVALQAAQRARPVIASNVFGLKEVIAHGRSGVLIEPNCPDLLAQAIDELLSKPEKRVQMGNAAYLRAQEFTIEKTAKNYVKMYEKATCERHHPCA